MDDERRPPDGPPAHGDPRPLAEGPLSVDLLNTMWRVDDETVDWLDEDRGVVGFCRAQGHEVADADLDDTRAALVDVRALVRRLFEDLTAGRIDDRLVRDVDDALEPARARLVTTPDGARMELVGDGPRAVPVRALVDALRVAEEHPDRLRSCSDGHCTLWFVDTSRSGRRRWCSMERCGNRAKARRHYQRHAAD